ncbi:helix-turn-helix transcriptional regulator [Novosphingobium colocasiae]
MPGSRPSSTKFCGSFPKNRTSKEIAWELGISESAVNQRIESIRARAGSPPRAELARVYRQYQAEIDAACNSLTANNLQLPDAAGSR